MKALSLLQKLQTIGNNYSQIKAIIGLGSSGLQNDRIDQYSDVDFFLIVDDGYFDFFFRDLNWLHNEENIAYHFRNTTDGYKILFENGLFCEMAIFEEHALQNIPFDNGRFIYKSDRISDYVLYSRNNRFRTTNNDTYYKVNEALTNLYVGLSRENRGEKMSAFRFIQVSAMDKVMELIENKEDPDFSYPHIDKYCVERRIEKRFSSYTPLLANMVQGYKKNKESAAAILQFLNDHYTINERMKQEVERLIKE